MAEFSGDAFRHFSGAKLHNWTRKLVALPALSRNLKDVAMEHFIVSILIKSNGFFELSSQMLSQKWSLWPWHTLVLSLVLGRAE